MHSNTKAHAPQASCPSAHLHVPAHAQQQAQVYAESPDVRAGFAGDPEHCQVALLVVLVELGLVNGSDAQLALHSADEWGSLEERACI